MLELKNICLAKGNFSLRSISLKVEKGDYFMILGPSGAGKSMILETIAGLIIPDSGSVILKGRDITTAKIRERRIGIVFQDHAIFPHMTVAGNIGYALKHLPGKHQKHQLIDSVAEELAISHLLNRSPSTLSGGELQRVALARTLVQKPDVLLLDEPLASIDVMLKDDLRRLLRKLNRKGQTIIHVTHDFDEAVSLASGIAVIQNGALIQQGTPDEVFHHPASSFVAGFTGTKNFFRVTSADEPDTVITEKGIKIRIADTPGPTGFILIRSEDLFLTVSETETSAVNKFKGIITDIVPSRHGVEITVDAGLQFYVQITVESLKKFALQKGSTVWVHFKASAITPVGVTN